MSIQLFRSSRVLVSSIRNVHHNRAFSNSILRHTNFRYLPLRCQHINFHVRRRFCQQPSAADTGKAKRAQKMAARKNSLKEDEEIDLVSGTGFLVMSIAAVFFYSIWKIDQEKNTGHSSVTHGFQKLFGGGRKLEDYLEKVEKHGRPVVTPADWGVWYTAFDHIKNMVTLQGNWESLYSKCFRLVSSPEENLLPPMREMGGMVQRTLVVDLETVIHSTWSRTTDYERHPRPYWKEFLKRMAFCGWEVVVFLYDEEMDWQENPEHAKVIDEHGYLGGILWGKDAIYFNGHKCKDLSRLNRKLNQVVMLDSNPKNVQMNPENAVMLTPWKGENPNDNELEDVALFLEYLQKADVDDVREVIADYRGHHIPSAFREAYLEHLAGQRA